jgi:P-type Ca2+ transporter type 2C
VPSLREQYGYNEFSVAASEPLFIKFIKTIYETPLILLLCGSALVSAVMGNIDDAVSITVAVLIVLTVGFVQEQRSEKRLEALNKLVPHHCHLLRDGKQLHLLANELIPGDIVTFTTGDRIPADVRILSAADLEVDESSLTGETDARIKGVEPCALGVPMAERSSIAHLGTLVKNGKIFRFCLVCRAWADVWQGRGTGIVVATGAQTEFGVVFTMVQDVGLSFMCCWNAP